MRRFVLGWKSLGCERRFNVRIVNYADDFVIWCKGRADEAMTAMRGMMGRLKLSVNEDKTRICRLPEGRFDFLGYNFGRCYSTKTGRPYLGTRPSKKSLKRIVESVHKGPATDKPHSYRNRVTSRLYPFSVFSSKGLIWSIPAIRGHQRMTKPMLPVQLPKSDALMAVERTLEQLAEFIESNPTYQQPGAEHIRAVIGYLAWARNNQHLARRVDV